MTLPFRFRGRRCRLPPLLAALASVAFGVTVSRGSEVWWTNAVFCEVFVRGFQNSNGDLRELAARLDRSSNGDPGTTDDLGITALWLMPICESPSTYEHDGTDYDNTEPVCATRMASWQFSTGRPSGADPRSPRTTLLPSR